MQEVKTRGGAIAITVELDKARPLHTRYFAYTPSFQVGWNEPNKHHDQRWPHMACSLAYASTAEKAVDQVQEACLLNCWVDYKSEVVWDLKIDDRTFYRPL